MWACPSALASVRPLTARMTGGSSSRRCMGTDTAAEAAPGAALPTLAPPSPLPPAPLDSEARFTVLSERVLHQRYLTLYNRTVRFPDTAPVDYSSSSSSGSSQVRGRCVSCGGRGTHLPAGSHKCCCCSGDTGYCCFLLCLSRTETPPPRQQQNHHRRRSSSSSSTISTSSATRSAPLPLPSSFPTTRRRRRRQRRPPTALPPPPPPQQLPAGARTERAA